MIGIANVVLFVVCVVRLITTSLFHSAKADAMDAERSSQPEVDTIARVITHFDADLPQWHVVIQMRTGELVRYGKFVSL